MHLVVGLKFYIQYVTFIVQPQIFKQNFTLSELLRSYFIALSLFGAHVWDGARSKWSLWSLEENRKAKAHALLFWQQHGNISMAF